MDDFSPVRLVDAVIVLTVLEAGALAAWHRLRRSGPPPREWLVNMVAGLCLMLALRAALHDQPWWAWAAWLAGAGIAHAADMTWRWKRIRRPS